MRGIALLLLLILYLPAEARDFPERPVRLVVPQPPGGTTGDGMDPVGSSPEAFGAFLRAEIDKWAPVVRASGAKPE